MGHGLAMIALEFDYIHLFLQQHQRKLGTINSTVVGRLKKVVKRHPVF